MLNKYKFKRNKDLNINFNLSTRISLEGDGGSSLLISETDSSINKSRSGDKLRVKKSGATIINFEFFDGVNYTTDLRAAGFNENELTTIGDNLFSSFFFFRVYDTPNQLNLLHTSYLNGYQFYAKYGSSTIFNLNGELEYNNIYLLERMSEINIAYVKFNFYNAKTGIIHSFISDENNSELVEVNILNKEYNFINTIINLKENTNITYNSIINNNNNSNKLELPNYPLEKGFENGTYTII